MAFLEFWPVDDEEDVQGIPINPAEFHEARLWCEDEGRPGAYKYGYRWGADIRGMGEDRFICFWFTDRDTAFEFTLRFRDGPSSLVR